MDILRAIVVGAAVLTPLVAGAEDLTSPSDLAPMALQSFSTPPSRIGSAQVFDQHGHAVGTVKGVQTDASGKPSALSIQPDNGPLTVVAANQVSYDQERNVVVTAVEPQGIASAR